jgi:preprotein translocase subunit SecG
MVTVVIVIHLMVVLAMIGLVLLQRSDGGALGIGGGGGNFLSGRGAGNVLTRSTAIFACAFFATSIALTVLARMESRPSDILDRLGAPVTAPAPVAPAPAMPTTGEAPSAQSVLDSLGAPQQEPAPAAQEPETPAPASPAPTSPASQATESAPAAPTGTTGQGQ